LHGSAILWRADQETIERRHLHGSPCFRGGHSGKQTSRKERPMKVRKSLRSLKNKPGAQVVRRRGKVYVINKKDPRFKARQG